MRYLVEERYPDAERLYLVQDNLNTHTAGALYEAFSPQRARAILDRLEFHPTPKHGSWLNQAEIEISVFERGCLSRPVPDTATLEQRVRALEAERNARHATIEWQFTARQARVKLKQHYRCPTSGLTERELHHPAGMPDARTWAPALDRERRRDVARRHPPPLGSSGGVA
jgi:hypothetical protein